MNQMLMNHVVMDIDSTKQYLDLASRTMMRAIGSLEAEQLNATPAARPALVYSAPDQCPDLLIRET